ncbi:hypothetical protein [Marinivivus vitaminiproducens]|uniref:hypothetical protein n=1 Tax=Marinivivus vitaminiproducens TaxID=3035935 RepID=UPI0027A6B502|nr:hypothetical protein P4R82_04680 [Geminicoccaceae bacterium SCSIO 64248]
MVKKDVWLKSTSFRCPECGSTDRGCSIFVDPDSPLAGDLWSKVRSVHFCGRCNSRVPGHLASPASRVAAAAVKREWETVWRSGA